MFTLHKLKEGFIVASDEKIKVDDYYIAWETDYATEPKERWVLYNLVSGLNGINQKKVIAQQLNIIFDLSEDECLRIGWWDVESMSKKHQLGNYEWQEGKRISFKEGFQKALSLLSEKKFTESDMRQALSDSFMASSEGYNITADEIIKSLTPTSWQIEGHMEGDKFKITKIL